jgi:methylmalonyl-CoA/ethylmalonyl-CoA epimerase
VSLLNKIHHINLLVRDLDAAVERYRATFGIEDFHREALPERGVRTARFRAGESWVVLVQPTRPDGVPGRYLAEHGEGLFLMSFGVDGLDSARAHMVDAVPGVVAGEQRNGLAGWQVLDLDPALFNGALLQLTEDPADSN